ncbi:uncharacterized protein PV06_02649 [Exophiala oligosperma]|uniref:Flavin reductase like domain-containing protein n=2 Tax=Chaetothyriales TaxID=34395 RepID=A0A0D2CB28_9EURO|nr:uncharacterized protein PV06_02649 [Exophiala oligosperma]KAJ9633002.1 hypothetical protein H2204_007392 [Knufia peltigerae]KIW47037.1 hypothetical protein PV06_02649 [Exophiala oligosperma]
MLSNVGFTRPSRSVGAAWKFSRGTLRSGISASPARQLSSVTKTHKRRTPSPCRLETTRDAPVGQVRPPCFPGVRTVTTKAQGEPVPNERTTSDSQVDEIVKPPPPTSGQVGSAPSNDLLSKQVRALMRHVAHPVTVITATDISFSPKGDPRSWKGATVSSFNTVTLDPDPIVSFNIKKISSTFQAIENSGHFAAHFMSGLQPLSVRIAIKFSRGNHASPFHNVDGKLNEHAIKHNAHTLTGKPPVLHHDSRVVPLRLACEYMPSKLVHIGDHVVVFGRVTSVDYPTEMPELVGAKGLTPILSYANGGYGHNGRFNTYRRVQLEGEIPETLLDPKTRQ